MCACANVQSVVIPDTPGQEVVAVAPMRARAIPWPGPSHLVPEPLGFGQHVVQPRQHLAEPFRGERLAFPFLGHGPPRYVSRRHP